ncbi:MAG: response regulator transcription factor [Bacteroidetes bacterium]|nr:MAG: response regulator transcription factor [Bacteroidota bacterium]
MSKILLAEDDLSFGYILKEYLEINGFEVVWAKDGNQGLREFNLGTFDLCILDIMMPVKDGFTLAKEIEEIDPEVPFIFLTAKALKVDKLKGFRLGCDDYVVKPIDEELFIARVRAIIKRSATSDKVGNNTYTIGKYLFSYTNQTLLINDSIERLTMKEAKVLQIFCDHKNQLVSRTKTLKSVWGINDFFNRKSMDVFIFKLRRKLKDDPSVKITNVHGKGFLLEVPEELS